MARFETGDMVLGRYRVQGLVVEETTEERYAAEHQDMGHSVQLRCFIGPSDSTQLARFERSARMMARVRDPRIVSLLDYGVEGGTPLVALEHVDGRTVRDLITESAALDWPQAVAITETLLDAVAALHAVSVLHRHIRPASVVLLRAPTAEGVWVKLSDLGLAKPMWQQDSRITEVGRVVGTPMYMAPEQLDLDTTDERSDLYAVGLVLYEMMTGNIPEGSRTRLSLARRLVSDPTAPVAPTGRPTIPPNLTRAIMRALARDPDGRYQTAAEFKQALIQARQAEWSAATAGEPETTIPLWRTTEAPPRESRVLRLQPTRPRMSAARVLHSARVAELRPPELSTYPVRALVACRVGHDTDSTTRGTVETLLQRYGDTYRVSDTAWIGTVRSATATGASSSSHELAHALGRLVGPKGGVAVECGGEVIDVPEATLAGLAPPTMEMMRLLDRASAQLRR